MVCWTWQHPTNLTDISFRIDIIIKKPEKNIRIVHCSLQNLEVRSSIIGFVIKDTGMFIMIQGLRIHIIIIKVEIGQNINHKDIDVTQWSAVYNWLQIESALISFISRKSIAATQWSAVYNWLQIEYAVMSFRIERILLLPSEVQSSIIGFKLSML